MLICVDLTCLTEQNQDTGPGGQGWGQELGNRHLQEGVMAGEAARHPLAFAASQLVGGGRGARAQERASAPLKPSSHHSAQREGGV